MTSLTPFLASLIALRDAYGKGHSEHVMELSASLGREIKLSSAQIDLLTFAAQIHDSTEKTFSKHKDTQAAQVLKLIMRQISRF